MKIENKAKTRQEIAQDLGISYSTFWRLMKKLEISLPNGLIYPSKQQEIHDLLLNTRNSNRMSDK